MSEFHEVRKLNMRDYPIDEDVDQGQYIEYIQAIRAEAESYRDMMKDKTGDHEAFSWEIQ